MDFERLPRRLTLCISALAFALAVRYGTFVPWGTDAAGYIESASRWTNGALAKPQPLALGSSWNPDGTLTVPLAFRPGIEKGTDVAIYPLGYPVLMAAAQKLSGEFGPFLVAPLLFGVLVWGTSRVGTAIAGPWAGLLAAALMAASPVGFVSAVQPMSDVPATALWVLAWAMSLRAGLWASAASGAACAMAIMVRPNLAPLGALVAWLQVAGPGVATRGGG